MFLSTMAAQATNEQKEEVKEQKEPEVALPNYLGKTNDIQKELENVKKEYGKSYAELYSRKLVQVGIMDNKKLTLKIMQFNVLADGLSGVHVNQSNKDSQSAKKTFDVPQEALVFKYRGFRILEEIARNDPDILCMEECDQFDFYLHYLAPLGYKGEFNPKMKSPCLKIAKAAGIKLNADGVAIFYRNTFQVSAVAKYQEKIPNMDNMDIPAISMVITEPKSKKSILVAVAHLKSTKDAGGETIRLAQLQHLLPKLQAASVAANPKLPVFFCCDLNTNNHETWSVAYDSIAFPDKLDPKNKDKPAVPKEYKAGYNGLNLYSAYFEAAIADKKLGISADKKANSEPVYTTWKSRGGNVLKHTIDYIFYQQDMAKVVGLLTIPSDKEVNQKTFYPGFEYPSDHVAIMAQFQI